MLLFSGNRPLLEKSRRGDGEVRRDVAEGPERVQHQPEGEVRRGPEERDQETAAAERPDQDMDRLWGDQGQVHPHGKAETHRDGRTTSQQFSDVLVMAKVFFRHLTSYFLPGFPNSGKIT